MIFDRSIETFLADSYSNELVLESGRLVARKRVSSEETTSNITRAVFEELVTRSSTDAQARQIVNKVRLWQVRKTPSQDGMLGAISSFFSSVFSRTPALEVSLNLWVEQKIGDPEYASRVKAARKIRDCFDLNQTNLDLSHLHLTSLPASIGELSHLTHLNLSENTLSDLPLEMRHLTNLIHLSCETNRFLTIPDVVFSLRKLEKLDFSENLLSAIPAGIGQLRSLTILNLSFNRITEISSEISRLSLLRNLFLKNNQLTALPDAIFQLPLTYLHVGRNQIRAIPSEIRRLHLLKRLDINHNQLTSLPNEICDLSRLMVFNCHHNLIERFPTTLYRLVNLETFNYYENPLVEEPIFALAPSETEVKTIEGGLQYWLNQKRALIDHLSSTTFDLTALFPNLIAHPAKDQMGEFLCRLKEMKDFRTDSQKPRIAETVYQIMQLAESNEEFRQKLADIATDVLSSCGDGITLGFNDVVISFLIHKNGSTELSLAKVLIGAKRKVLLDQEAFVAAGMIGRQAESREIALYLQVRCKAALKLPIINSDMLYTEVGRVHEGILRAIETRILEATNTKEQITLILKESSFWSDSIRRKYAAEVDVIVARNAERLDALMERTDLSQADFLSATNQIQIDQKKEMDDFILAKTEAFVAENFEEII